MHRASIHLEFTLLSPATVIRIQVADGVDGHAESILKDYEYGFRYLSALPVLCSCRGALRQGSGMYLHWLRVLRVKLSCRRPKSFFNF